MRKPVDVIVLAGVAAALAGLAGCGQKKAPPRSIRLYAGAGLRRAVEQLSAEFEKQTGIRVEPDYAGSGMLVTRAQADPDADLFMPGDVWYVDRLQDKAGLIAEKTPVAYFVPVIIVAKGNPKAIRSLADFFRPDVAVALGKADACQVGRISGAILAKNGLDRGHLTPKESLTVNELGVWVKMKDVDGAIVWDAIAANIADAVEVVEIPPDKNVISRVVVGRMTTSKDRDAAKRFVTFMTGPTGREILRRNGYRIDAP